MSHRALLSPIRIAALLPLLIALAASPARAQYMYLDTNGDGVNSAADLIAASGATSVDVWLATDRNKDGSAAACATADGALTLAAYDIVLEAVDGEVTWGDPVSARPEFGGVTSAYSTVTRARFGTLAGTPLAPGLYKLATIPVTPAAGTPSIRIPSPAASGDMIASSFVSNCSGNDFDGNLKLGLDWFDTDGAAYAGVPNQAPDFPVAATLTMREADPMVVALQATDADGEPLDFSLRAGPSFAAVATTDRGSGAATGTLSLTPGYFDAGDYPLTLAVADRFHTTERAVALHVENVNRPPVFTLVPMPMVPEGGDVEYALTVLDADQEAIAVRVVAGPTYMTLGVSNADLGRVSAVLRFRPGYFDAGMTTAVIGATDGTIEVLQPVEIMIRNVDRPPTIAAPDTIAAAEGDAVAFTADAPDPDGEMVVLTATGLPDGATFVDAMSNHADFRWVPRYDQAGSYAVMLEADDRQGGVASHRLGISVSDVVASVALAAPWPMRLGEGETASQTLAAFDADGSPLAFRLASGPAYVAVGTTDAGTGLASGVVRAAPGFDDAGVASVTVEASDGVSSASRTFAVEVIDIPPGVTPGGPPVAPPFPTVATGQTPHTVTMADLDRDGHLDLIVAAMNSSAVSVYLGAGDGTFGMRRDFATATRVHTVAARDLNGDGILDLALSHTGANSVGSMLGVGDGTVGPRRDVPIGGTPIFLGVGDFDGDGRPDLASTDATHGELVILRGAGDGTFAVTGRYAAAAGSHGLVIADFNKDGALDVAMANDGAHVVSIHLGRGDGTFEPARLLQVGEPHTVAAGDVDEDGILDLVVSNYHHGTISICHGHGDGDFTEVAEIATGADAHATTVADLDADGHPDIVAVNQAAGTVSFLMGRGGGALAPRVDFPVGLGAHSVLTADFDEDGALDVVLSSLFTNTVSLIRNLRPPPLPGRAFTGPEDQLVVLNAAKPTRRVYVESLGGAAGFAVESIDPASVRLERSGGSGEGGPIQPVTSKRVVIADRDRNGAAEAAFDFASSALRSLFAGVVGRAVVEAVVTGTLEGGRRFRAPLVLTVIGAGRPSPPVAVSPNPLNPEGVLTFETASPGPVRVRLVDVQGRLVSKLFEGANVAAGLHRIALRPGGRIASGVYFVRVETSEEVRATRVVLLK
ncbi:MAG TPA: FG-GAP-like repeat-containing protein [Candidatus Eisenbacteria bacterium]|nr:FG-GAP-like repeat-containing protein [Candidatus Eisenbacteria bacterium]